MLRKRQRIMTLRRISHLQVTASSAVMASGAANSGENRRFPEKTHSRCVSPVLACNLLLLQALAKEYPNRHLSGHGLIVSRIDRSAGGPGCSGASLCAWIHGVSTRGDFDLCVQRDCGSTIGRLSSGVMFVAIAQYVLDEVVNQRRRVFRDVSKTRLIFIGRLPLLQGLALFWVGFRERIHSVAKSIF